MEIKIPEQWKRYSENPKNVIDTFLFNVTGVVRAMDWSIWEYGIEGDYKDVRLQLTSHTPCILSAGCY